MSNTYIENSRSRTADALISVDNSTSALLLASGVFTGPADDVFAYSSVSVNAYADQAGSLEIRQSADGANWDHVKQFDISANKSALNACTIGARYVQVRYTNGAVDQGAFRLQTIYHMQKTVQESNKSDSTAILTEDAESQLVRVMNDEMLDLVTGKYASRKQVKIFGYANEIKKTLDEMIRDEAGEGNDHAFLTVADTVRVKAGGSTNDIDSTGSGARKVEVSGLDENFDLASEVLALAGASASAVSTTTFIRVFGAKITECGTYGGKADADINIESSGGAPLCRIREDFSESKKASYCIPAGKTAYIKSVNASVPADKLGYVNLYTREGADVTTAPFKPKVSALKWQVQGTSNDQAEVEYAFALPEKTDIWCSMISEQGDINDAACQFTLLEIAN